MSLRLGLMSVSIEPRLCSHGQGDGRDEGNNHFQFQSSHDFAVMDSAVTGGMKVEDSTKVFPMENHINQKQGAAYSPPPDGLFLPGFAIEMAPSSRMRAFFLLSSFR